MEAFILTTATVIGLPGLAVAAWAHLNAKRSLARAVLEVQLPAPKRLRLVPRG
jgi:hypothetical protein